MFIFDKKIGMSESLIKNEKQLVFNQVRGFLDEINEGNDFCNITLKVGHENPRMVNITMKRTQFDEMIKTHTLGEKITCRFYISSRKKYDRWYTTASLLDIRKDV
jgi:hypothetical protein